MNRTRVYEIPVGGLFNVDDSMKVMVEDFADGSQSVALRFSTETSWSQKYRPVMDDDGDHLREPETEAYELSPSYPVKPIIAVFYNEDPA